jgi:hypothetical protein
MDSAPTLVERSNSSTLDLSHCGGRCSLMEVRCSDGRKRGCFMV